MYFYLFFNLAHALQSNWGGIDEAKLRIISPISTAGDNPTIFLGIEYKLKDGWKPYWRAPGDGGLPQTLDWSESINVSKLEILWPTPIEFEILGFKSIGYENEVVFPLKIELDELNQSSTILFNINFLTCKDICIPGQANLKIILPAGKGHTTNHLFQLEEYLSRVPLEKNKNKISGLEILETSAFKDKNFVSINIQATSKSFFHDPKFFLDTSLGLPVISPQYTYSSNRKNIKANFLFDKSLFSNDKFDLAILLSDKKNSIEYKSSIKIENKSILFYTYQSYLYIFFISILGGLVLNFMPCVLPVLSIKLLSLISNREESLTLIRKSFVITSLGIISSFLLLAFVLIILKLSGNSIGWGMQFQQPLFLMIIALILYLFSLNLFGFFEFNLPRFISNSLSFSNINKSFYKDYFNGFFATVLATPCSAPFVGVAITAAFTQSSLVMMCIFFFMGVGMAIPYLLTSLFPKLVWLFPKSGPWINNIKYILAILLLATLGWIGMILFNHFNYIFIIFSLFLALIILFSFKYLNKIKPLIISVIIVIFFSFNYLPVLDKDTKKDEKNWLNLTNVNIKNMIKENKIVFVDITADWCATCQFNKINVINSKKIKKVFKDNNIVKVRGDWTKPNQQIREYLDSYKRFGIPFNILYNASYPEGIILSELLTKSEIIDTIEILKKDKN